MPTFKETVLSLTKAGYQAVLVTTPQQEHQKALLALAELAGSVNYRVAVWTPYAGLGLLPEGGATPADSNPVVESFVPGTGPLRNAVRAAADSDELPGKLFAVFKWAVPGLNADEVVRTHVCDLVAGELLHTRHGQKRMAFFLAQTGQAVHPDLVSHLQEVEFGLPTAGDLTSMVARHNTGLPDWAKPCVGEAVGRMTRALRGLGTKGAADALAGATVVCKNLSSEAAVRHAADAKNFILRAGTALRPEPWDSIPEASALAGMGEVIAWARGRAKAFTDLGRRHRVEPPHLLLVAGVAGSGKSSVSKVLARVFDKPLYRLDLGACLRPHVGESERVFRETLQAADALGEGVLFMDEIEKALAGSQSGAGDSGVRRGIFGLLLTWLAEMKNEIIMIGTCNSFSDLAPEFLRRADVVWGVDLPYPDEAWAILGIHCKAQCGLDLNDQPYASARDEILAACVNYTGSDIVFGVRESHFLSLDNPEAGSTEFRCGRPTVDQLVAGLKTVTPLVERDPEGVAAQRELVRKNTRAVSSARAKSWREESRAASKRR